MTRGIHCIHWATPPDGRRRALAASLAAVLMALFTAMPIVPQPLGAQETAVESPLYRLTDRDAELMRTLIPVDLRDIKAAPEMEDPAFRKSLADMTAIQDAKAATAAQILDGTLDPYAKLQKIVGPIALPPGVRLDRACSAELFPLYKAVYRPIGPPRATEAGAAAAALFRRANPTADDVNAAVVRTGVDFGGEWQAFLATKYPVVQGQYPIVSYQRRRDDPLTVSVDLASGVMRCNGAPALIGVTIPDDVWLRETLTQDALPAQRTAELPAVLRRMDTSDEHYRNILVKAQGARRSAAWGGEVEDPPAALDTPEYKAMREAERANLRWWARHKQTLEPLLAEYERVNP